MAQLTRITLTNGVCRYFRCPYQANVIKILDMVSNTIVVIAVYAASTAYILATRYNDNLGFILSGLREQQESSLVFFPLF